MYTVLKLNNDVDIVGNTVFFVSKFLTDIQSFSLFFFKNNEKIR